MQQPIAFKWVVTTTLILVVLMFGGMIFLFYQMTGEVSVKPFLPMMVLALLLIPNAAYFFYHRKSGVFRWLMFLTMMGSAIFRDILSPLVKINMTWLMLGYLVVLGVANVFTYREKHSASLKS